jgi:hypothetical protein
MIPATADLLIASQSICLVLTVKLDSWATASNTTGEPAGQSASAK